jgi:hypothetical protein
VGGNFKAAARTDRQCNQEPLELVDAQALRRYRRRLSLQAPRASPQCRPGFRAPSLQENKDGGHAGLDCRAPRAACWCSGPLFRRRAGSFGPPPFLQRPAREACHHHDLVCRRAAICAEFSPPPQSPGDAFFLLLFFFFGFFRRSNLRVPGHCVVMVYLCVYVSYVCVCTKSMHIRSMHIYPKCVYMYMYMCKYIMPV